MFDNFWKNVGENKLFGLLLKSRRENVRKIQGGGERKMKKYFDVGENCSIIGVSGCN